jgi:phosphoribosylformimino-5-aminoimidazole carboxamide ribotide isomerase
VRVIGVLDLRRGLAVHARGGERARYAPVARVAGVAVPEGDPFAVARHYLDALGVRELYAADLDAIVEGAPQAALARGLAALGAPLWLDAAVTTPGAARDAVALGAARVVVGLETLARLDALAPIADAVGGARVALSVDLRAGVLLARAAVLDRGARPEDVAAAAADSGVGAVIVLDLARVGSGRGVDLDLLARVRRAVPGVALLAGGGVRDAADLGRLADAGCDGALVASALHDGRIGPDDVARVAQRGSGRGGGSEGGGHGGRGGEAGRETA